MSLGRGVVAGRIVAPVSAFGQELAPEALQEAVIGLAQFGVG